MLADPRIRGALCNKILNTYVFFLQWKKEYFIKLINNAWEDIKEINV